MLKGKLLISPKILIGDIFFNKAIVLVVENKDSGSLGFVINKKLKYSLSDIVNEAKTPFPIYLGGPVEQDNLFFIHNCNNLIPNGELINENLFWGGDFKKAIKLINDKKINNKNICFYQGYTGWSSSQLEHEIKNNLWVIKENSFKSKIIKRRKKYLWKDFMISFGGDHLIWANSPDNPYLN
ncbi:MAG: transcriptional regulator [Flavobacteriaceae bacterium]|nr:transcriptional regulator [Flavobacteriaceae bacterium]|tara:strand:+ start:3288 stop:3833 length:546 start_codon:yes stop_codon:yes gene_type:complete